MKQKLINIIVSQFFIALVLFAVVFVFIPKGLFEKYMIIPTSNSILANVDSYVYYNDLDNDGKSEKIRRYIDNKGMNAMNVYSHEGSIVDQFNFGRETELGSRLFAFDRNENGFKEVFTLSHSNDSIFLNWVEPLNDMDNMPRSRFVTTMQINRYGNIDYGTSAFLCADLDSDGDNEVVFSINGGYSKYPRGVFAYDFHLDSVYSSPFTGAKVHILNITDINNDGYDEVIVCTNAPANIPANDSILDDEHSYLMVFDHNLNFLFKPVPFFGYPSSIHVYPMHVNSEMNLITRFSITGTNGEDPKLMVYSHLGKLINERGIESKVSYFYEIRNGNNETFALYEPKSGIFELYDAGLNTIGKTVINKNLNLKQYDLDGDGINEWIGKDNSDIQTIWVFRQNFTQAVKIKIPIPGAYKHTFRIGFIQDGSSSQIYVQKDEYEFIFDYKKNPYYLMKFPFYFGIYLILLLIVFIIQKLQNYQTERKLALEKQISELQLKTIRSQMDPHFTFNALNTISSIIYKEDKEKAHRYFTKFSKLVRATLDASERITRTLGEELDFTENYLMLEKIRFKDKFEYRINISENVNKDQSIPKMIIQIYVENAIKHGLKHKEKDGLLKIDVSNNKRGRLLPLMIIIEDNGIGRKKAAELETFGTGHGMKIMETIGELYFKLYKIEIKQKVEDLFGKAGDAAGTRVVIEIPEKEESKL